MIKIVTQIENLIILSKVIKIMGATKGGLQIPLLSMFFAQITPQNAKSLLNPAGYQIDVSRINAN